MSLYFFSKVDVEHIMDDTNLIPNLKKGNTSLLHVVHHLDINDTLFV